MQSIFETEIIIEHEIMHHYLLNAYFY